MLFLTYWELNENMGEDERLQAARKLTEAEAFPPEGVKIVQWVASPDLWGVTIFEAESEIAVLKTLAMWRKLPGFFKSVKTAPAMNIEEMMPKLAEYMKSRPT